MRAKVRGGRRRAPSSSLTTRRVSLVASRVAVVSLSWRARKPTGGVCPLAALALLGSGVDGCWLAGEVVTRPTLLSRRGVRLCSGEGPLSGGCRALCLGAAWVRQRAYIAFGCVPSGARRVSTLAGRNAPIEQNKEKKKSGMRLLAVGKILRGDVHIYADFHCFCFTCWPLFFM